MVDGSHLLPSVDNIRTLTYYLGLVIDHRLSAMRRDTPYAQVRSSDIRVFVTAARKVSTISAISRELCISRQSVQASVKRLVELGVVELVSTEDNQRDKQVHITPRGRMAAVTAANQILQIEVDFAGVIGPEAWPAFHNNIKKLVQAYSKDLQKVAS